MPGESIVGRMKSVARCGVRTGGTNSRRLHVNVVRPTIWYLNFAAASKRNSRISHGNVVMPSIMRTSWCSSRNLPMATD
eukprot:2955040-Heterocapsa_arctica.AAC.1